MPRLENNIRKLRKDAGFSVHELARAVGVSDSSISKWESCVKHPKLYNAIALADVLGCTLDGLGFKVVDDDDDDC